MPEVRLPFLRKLHRIEASRRLTEIVSHQQLHGLTHMQLVIKRDHLVDFFLWIDSPLACEQGLQPLTIHRRSQLQGFQVHQGLLVLHDVATCHLAEDRHVAVAVQDVILQLKRHAQRDAEII